MKLRMYHAVSILCILQTYAQQAIPPMPQPDQALIENLQLALEAVFGVGIRLQAFLQDDQNDNFLVSPISATVIIAQLILGAQGEFRTQLVELLELDRSHQYENDIIQYYNKKKNITYFLPYSTLHLQLSHLLKQLENGSAKNFALTENSALFYDQKITLNDTFRKGLKGLYDAHILPLDFSGNPPASQKTINEWVNKNTNGLIRSLLSGPPPPRTTAIFANTIYFKADWETPFSDTLNRAGLFNVSATRTVPVEYMINQMDLIPYSESKDYRLIGLPYRNEELVMYLILPRANNPDKYNIKNFVQNLKSREVLETLSHARRRDVVVKIPKMSLSNSFSILDQLKKYQVFKRQNIKINATNVVDKIEDKVDAFMNFTTRVESDIYLTSASVNVPLRVSDIVQQVVITVNEKGTEAAAVSAATIDYMGGAKNFIIERPFVFFINHIATGATLFWGTVANPTA